MKPTCAAVLARLRAAEGGWVTHPGKLMGLGGTPSKETVKRWRRGLAYRTALGHLVERIEIDANGCWIWQGQPNHHGYGVVSHWQFGSGLAHRFAWFVFRGRVAEGLTLDHLCRVRLCVNPDHLEPVTMRENLYRSPLVIRSECVHGHRYTPENTINRKRGGRECRTCVNGRRRVAA